MSSSFYQGYTVWSNRWILRRTWWIIITNNTIIKQTNQPIEERANWIEHFIERMYTLQASNELKWWFKLKKINTAEQDVWQMYEHQIEDEFCWYKRIATKIRIKSGEVFSQFPFFFRYTEKRETRIKQIALNDLFCFFLLVDFWWFQHKIVHSYQSGVQFLKLASLGCYQSDRAIYENRGEWGDLNRREIIIEIPKTVCWLKISHFRRSRCYTIHFFVGMQSSVYQGEEKKYGEERTRVVAWLMINSINRPNQK